MKDPFGIAPRSRETSLGRALDAPTSTEDFPGGAPFGPIVWAMDAFPKSEMSHFATAEALKVFFPDFLVHAVYVLPETAFADKGYSNFLKPALKPNARKAMQKLVKFAPGVRTGSKPHVLLDKTGKGPSCAGKLLNFAGRIGAACIALGCLPTKGGRLTRYFHTRFSDVVLKESPVPVLVTGPAIEATSRTNRVLVVPGDFAALGIPAHDLALERKLASVLAFAGRLDCEVRFVDFSLRPSHDYWSRLLESSLVPASFVSQIFRDRPLESIVDFVKAEIEETQPLVAAFPGLLAQLDFQIHDLVRDCPCPVVLGPKYMERANH